MNLIERIADWLGLKPITPVDPRVIALRMAMDGAQQAKWQEDYEKALDMLERAGKILEEVQDSMAMAIVDLNRAEMLTMLGRWDEAEAVLHRTKEPAEKAGEKTRLAYVLCAFGVLAQEKDDWVSALEYYENALDIARKSGSAAAEGRASGFLAAAYLHEGNANYAEYLLRKALPKLDMSGDSDFSSYFVGLLGEALIINGNSTEGRRLMEHALLLAERMQYRRYRRHWRLALGRVAAVEGRYSESAGYYRKALNLFGTPLPVNKAYVDTLCRMSRVTMNLRQYDAALEYARMAHDAGEKLGDEVLYAAAQGILGVALRSTGEGSGALSHLETAAAAFEKQSIPDIHNLRIDILRHLAATQAETCDYETAFATYRGAIELAEKLDKSLELAQVHHDLGRLYRQQRQLADAIEEWVKALKIYEADNNHMQTARLYCDVAEARHLLGQGQRTMKDYEQALMLLNSVDDETRGIVLSNVANAYADRGDIESADAFFCEAIQIAQRLGDQQAEAARRGNYGWFLLITDQIQRAKITLKNAFKMSQQLGLNLQAAIQRSNMGLVCEQRCDFETALEFHEKALEQIMPLNNPHWENRFKINRANTLLSLDRVDEALPLFEEALTAGRKGSDITVIVQALTGLARVAIKVGEPERVEDRLVKAIRLARKADMRRLLAEILAVRSEQQAALNQHEQAISTWEEAHKMFTVLKAPKAKLEPTWLQVTGDRE